MPRYRQSRIPWCATFVQEHMSDRFFNIGARTRNGWVMDWCMAKLETVEHIPMAWQPSEIRDRKADEFAWQNNLCESDWPNQD